MLRNRLTVARGKAFGAGGRIENQNGKPKRAYSDLSEMVASCKHNPMKQAEKWAANPAIRPEKRFLSGHIITARDIVLRYPEQEDDEMKNPYEEPTKPIRPGSRSAAMMRPGLFLS